MYYPFMWMEISVFVYMHSYSKQKMMRKYRYIHLPSLFIKTFSLSQLHIPHP